MATKKSSSNNIVINAAISFGASVVIIGLMFKLLHWQGGELAIGLGLAVEALLFFLLGMQTLRSKGDEPVVVETVAATPRNTQMDDLLSTTINPNTIERLRHGFDQFTKTVESVNQITSYAGTTQKMMDEVELATKQMTELKQNIAQLNNVYRAQLEAFKK